jgi:Vault protein inter-alpha-trypsin domain/FecR protein
LSPRPRLGGASQGAALRRPQSSRGSVAAVLLSTVCLLIALLPSTPTRVAPEHEASLATLTSTANHGGDVERRSEYLMARAIVRPGAERLQVGDVVETNGTERRRVALPDESVLYVNADTTLRVVSERNIAMDRGEIYVEVAQQLDENQSLQRFEIETAGRTVTALGTRFRVTADTDEANVLVTQGRVQVDGVDQTVIAGQEVTFNTSPPNGEALRSAGTAMLTAAPRAAAQLDWTQDLMQAAGGTLVAASEYAGGALVAVDPNGQSSRLSLRKYHVDVHIEDGFARTTIDQTYFNHTSSRLEGTFHFPLPADASLSRLAMYVNGKLIEGGMAERDHARNTFEQIVHKMQDPALLEWVDGTLFKMRVFPLEPRQEKRIILSYTQRLPAVYDKVIYRSPAGHSMNVVRDWSTKVRIANGAATEWKCPSHILKATSEDTDLVLTGSLKNAVLDRDLVIELTHPHHGVRAANVLSPLPRRGREGQGEGAVRGDRAAREIHAFSRVVHDDSSYLMCRLKPHIPGEMQRKPHHWIVLFEASGNRNPLLARTQIEIIRTLLENAEHSDTFEIITATTRPQRRTHGVVACSVENVRNAIIGLERTHLVGALDLEAAFKECVASGAKSAADDGTTLLVHVGAGLPALGQHDGKALQNLLPDGMAYIGIGVGARWNRPLMKMLAESTGGYFTQINPDENIAWRAFDVYSTIHSPRLHHVNVAWAKGDNARDNARDNDRGSFLQFADMIAQGEEIAAICRLQEGSHVPKAVTVTAVLDGQPWSRQIAVTDIVEDAEYLPRMWARLEIDRLLKDSAAANKDRIVELSKAMYVMSPFTSLLVLENEQMYVQHNIDRGRSDHWALYSCPAQIEVVQEPVSSNRTPAPVAAIKKDKLQRAITTIRRLSRARWRSTPAVGYRFGRTTDFGLSYSGGRDQPANGVTELYLYALPKADANGDANQWDEIYFDQPQAFDGWGFNRFGSPVVTPGLQPVRKLGLGVPSRFRGMVLPDSGDSPASVNNGTVVIPSYFGMVDEGFRRDVSFDDPWVARWYNNPGEFGGVQRTTEDESLVVSDPLGDRFETWGLSRTLGVKERARWDILYRLPEVTLDADLTRDWDDRKDNLFYDGLVINERLLRRINRKEDEVDQLQSLLEVEDSYGFRLGVTAGVPLGWRQLQLDYEAERETNSRFGQVGQYTPRQNSGLSRRLREEESQTDQTDAGRLVPVGNLHRWAAEAGPSDVPLVSLPGFAITPQYLDDGNRGTFGDLLSFAPALNTSRSDVLAILEAERESIQRSADVLSPHPRRERQGERGTVDPAARTLIEKARSRGWESLTIAGADGEPGVTIHYDGTGRHVWQRIVSEGLQEHVVCDGTTLWHIYDQIGLASKRPFSRFHHHDLNRMIPWLLPTADDLARHANVVAINNHTIELRPWQTVTPNSPLPRPGEKGHGEGSDAKLSASVDPILSPLPRRGGGQGEGAHAKPVTTSNAKRLVHRLIFSTDGRLAERQIHSVEGELLLRITMSANGVVTALGGGERVLSRIELHRATAPEPDLTPDLSDLVCLPMPVRSAEFASQRQPTDEDNNPQYSEWNEEAALSLMLADIVSGNSDRFIQVARQRFLDKGDRRAGIYVLLSRFPDNLVFTEHVGGTDGQRRDVDLRPDVEGSPLKQFIRQQINWLRDKDGGVDFELDGVDSGFLHQLVTGRNLYLRWKSGRAVNDRTESQIDVELDQALAFASACRTARFGWTLLSAMQPQLDSNAFRIRFATVAQRYESSPMLAGLVRTVRIQTLFAAGETAEARKLFRQWHRWMLSQGVVPAIDAEVYAAFVADDGEAEWADMIAATTDELVDQSRFVSALMISSQMRELGETELANHTLEKILAVLSVKANPYASLLLIDQLKQLQDPRSETLFSEAIELPMLADVAAIWRYSSEIADATNHKGEALRRLEKAVQLEFETRPAVINIETVNADYTELMNRYDQLVDAVNLVETTVPDDLALRIIRATDQWRSLVDDDTTPCRLASDVLVKLNLTEIAWDYLTTPLADNSGESGPWKSLAESLVKNDSIDLADMAWTRAFEFEQTNPEILLSHARMLQQHGQRQKARRLVQKVVGGKWQPRFSKTVDQARQLLLQL